MLFAIKKSQFKEETKNALDSFLNKARFRDFIKRVYSDPKNTRNKLIKIMTQRDRIKERERPSQPLQSYQIVHNISQASQYREEAL